MKKESYREYRVHRVNGNCEDPFWLRESALCFLRLRRLCGDAGLLLEKKLLLQQPHMGD